MTDLSDRDSLTLCVCDCFPMHGGVALFCVRRAIEKNILINQSIRGLRGGGSLYSFSRFSSSRTGFERSSPQHGLGGLLSLQQQQRGYGLRGRSAYYSTLPRYTYDLSSSARRCGYSTTTRMRPPLRIAVLECDEPIGRTKEKYGGYGNLFHELLDHSAKHLKAKEGKEVELDVTKYDVVRHEVYPELEGVDAVLLTGSKFNSFDNDPWILKLVEFVRGVLKQERVRLIGVCFGHQIIGRAMDVKVDRSDRGWEISVSKVQLTETGKRLFGLEEMVSDCISCSLAYERRGRRAGGGEESDVEDKRENSGVRSC